MRRDRISVRVAALLLLASLTLPATAGAVTPAATTLGSWTVTGNGHCATQHIYAYPAQPFVQGQLFEWMATSQLCDTNGAQPVDALMVQASVLTPAMTSQTCGWPTTVKKPFTGGSAVAVNPGAVGAVSYFEAGDGTAAAEPPEGIGTPSGNRPQPLGLCDGTWRVIVTTSFLDATSQTWLPIGTNEAHFDVSAHPSFLLERTKQVSFDSGPMFGAGHCIEHSFGLYDTTPQVRVGDLLEFWTKETSCDGPDVPADVISTRFKIFVRPAAGCTARKWLTPHSIVSIRSSSARLVSGFVLKYGTRNAAGEQEYPADWQSPPGPGIGSIEPAMIMVNCPGKVHVVQRTEVQTSSGGPYTLVGDSRRTFTVLPAST